MGCGSTRSIVTVLSCIALLINAACGFAVLKESSSILLPQTNSVQTNTFCKQYADVWRYKLPLGCFAAIHLHVVYSESDTVKSPLIEVR